MIKIITGASTKEEVPFLSPWTEYAGKVLDANEGSVTIESIHQISIPISIETLSKFKQAVQKGNDIAILALDDGSIRIRRVSRC
jgi:hypothetical protein